MKLGYTQAAWRLFQVTLAPPLRRPARVTWADTELEGTPVPVHAPAACPSSVPRARTERLRAAGVRPMPNDTLAPLLTLDFVAAVRHTQRPPCPPPA